MNRETQERARDHLRQALAYHEPKWEEVMAHVLAAYNLMWFDERHVHHGASNECRICGRDFNHELHQP